jgi:hypothetical protein
MGENKKQGAVLRLSGKEVTIGEFVGETDGLAQRDTGEWNHG